MKKYLSLFLTVLAVLLVILASCVGDDPAPTDTVETTAAADPETTREPETTQEVTEAPDTDPETTPDSETAPEGTVDETTAEEPTETTEPETEEDYTVVRTKEIPVKPISVDEAILQMNMVGHKFYMFTNAETGEVNVVYLRDDGKYGLLVPTAEN